MEEVLERTSTFDLKEVEALFETILREQTYIDELLIPKTRYHFNTKDFYENS